MSVFTKNYENKKCECLFVDFLADGFAFGFVSGFVEEGKHVAFVSLNAGLVEWIYTEDISAHATRFLEEIEELSEPEFGEGRDCDVDIGHSAIDVGDSGAEFCHFVHFIDMFSGEEVETVEVGVVGGDNGFVLLFGNRDNGFENRAFAILNPLTH